VDWWIGGLVIGGMVIGDWWTGRPTPGECSEISVEGVQKSVSTAISPHTPEGEFIRIGE